MDEIIVGDRVKIIDRPDYVSRSAGGDMYINRIGTITGFDMHRLNAYVEIPNMVGGKECLRFHITKLQIFKKDEDMSTEYNEGDQLCITIRKATVMKKNEDGSLSLKINDGRGAYIYPDGDVEIIRIKAAPPLMQPGQVYRLSGGRHILICRKDAEQVGEESILECFDPFGGLHLPVDYFDWDGATLVSNPWEITA